MLASPFYVSNIINKQISFAQSQRMLSLKMCVSIRVWETNLICANKNIYIICIVEANLSKISIKPVYKYEYKYF